MLLSSLFRHILFAFLASVAGHYQGVVVDATTGLPLSGVQVQNERTQVVSVSDSQGHVTIEEMPARLKVRCLGYAPLTVERREAEAWTDTIRLLPQRIVLDGVTVTPAKQVHLTAVPLQDRHKVAFGLAGVQALTPGVKIGILHFPPDTDATYQLNKIIVNIPKQHEAKAGRLRVRLVTVVGGNDSQPGSQDLLPVAAVFSAAEVNAARKTGLTIDVASYGIQLPKEGICVVAECLPTEPAESFVAIEKKGPDEKAKVNIITATEPSNRQTFRYTPVTDFIWIGAGPARTRAVTWRSGRDGKWTRVSQRDASYSADINALLDLVVQAK